MNTDVPGGSKAGPVAMIEIVALMIVKLFNATVRKV
jgi:hypothetical protein